jgi:VWFA-related protein
MRGIRLVAGVIIATAGFGSQNPPGATFRAGVELVQVNVVASDKQGTAVADLDRKEFQIFDNGVGQEIRVFVQESLFVQERGGPTPASALQPNTFSNRLAPASGTHSGYSVILIDDLYSGSDPDNEEGSTLSRVRALQMLRSIPEGQKIAIYAQGGKLRVISEFTSDRDQLVRELRKWKPRPTTPKSMQKNPAPFLQQPDPQAEAMRARADAEAERTEQARATGGGDAQMREIADHLGGIPGRKNLIWLANKFPMSPPALRALTRAGVSVYPVDIDGVCRLCPPRPRAEMDTIAAVTGGRAFYGRNDIHVAIREAMDDGRVGYTLGFYPSVTGDGPEKPHKLTVRVTRPGLTLRYSTAYVVDPPLATTVNPATNLRKALDRPIDATAIPIEVTVSRTREILKVDAHFDVESLDLTPENGRWTGRIEAAARFMTADALIASDAVAQTLVVNLSQTAWDAALRDGLEYHTELPIPPKAAELKLLFSNVASGRVGTLTIHLARVK